METKSTISSLRQLLDEDTSRFISAEVQLRNSLTEWISKDYSIPLQMILRKYLDMVGEHVKKLEDFCEEEKIASLSVTNRVMKAFIEETNEKLSTCSPSEVKDACLLAMIQAINHFKISAYGTSAAFAGMLELDKAAAIFHHAELDEKSIDQELSYLAKHEINLKARSPLALDDI